MRQIYISRTKFETVNVRGTKVYGEWKYRYFSVRRGWLFRVTNRQHYPCRKQTSGKHWIICESRKTVHLLSSLQFPCHYNDSWQLSGFPIKVNIFEIIRKLFTNFCSNCEPSIPLCLSTQPEALKLIRYGSIEPRSRVVCKVNEANT